MGGIKKAPSCGEVYPLVVFSNLSIVLVFCSVLSVWCLMSVCPTCVCACISVRYIRVGESFKERIGALLDKDDDDDDDDGMIV